MHHSSSRTSESGFVAIIVASILMVIMTLITIGFTQIMQREQRQALDRQLSTQAFYAAESAVNDFYTSLEAFYDDPTTYSFPGREKLDCDTSDFPALNDGKIDGVDGDISYTCLQYDLDPPTIEFNNGNITTNQSKVVPIQQADRENFTEITIGWEHQDTDGLDASVSGLAGSCAGDIVFPTDRASATPLMRIDLLRLPRTVSADNDELFATPINLEAATEQVLHLYLEPRNGCGTNSINFTDHNELDEKGQIVLTDCRKSTDARRDCELTIQMNDSAPQSDQYIMRMRSVYANANATISGATVAGDRTELKNAQVLVDATGKANDVLRRIQVRIKAKLQRDIEYSIPEPVFQAMSGFCKSITVIPPGSVNVNEGRVSLNPDLCQP